LFACCRGVILPPFPLGSFVSVGCGELAECALTTDKTIVCNGVNT
jgi:hypothetical protein